MLALALLFHLPVLALHASPCELMQNPAKYANQTVEVRARISIGFEDFTLVAPNCTGDPPPVWLAFGGDEPTPIMSMVNDPERKPGSVLKVNGQPIPLQRDAALDLFRRRLLARRLRLDGRACGGSPYLYRVTATITGAFFTRGKYGGYGHMGFNHLLVIQQVSDVVAERTTVPAGGRFTCSSDTWSIPSAEDQTLKASLTPCHYDCDPASAKEITAVADHWNDSPNLTQGTYSKFSDASLWCSEDSLKSYTFGLDNSLGGRTTCTAIEPPYPMSTNIGCRQFRKTFPPQNAPASEPGTAKAASRLLLQTVAKQWGITLVTDLKLTGCNSTVYQGDRISSCGWLDPEAMQSFTIQLKRLHSQRHHKSWDTVPWTLTRTEGIACEAEN
jgi:hypothetical protein